ncbi:hypothetical protein [uncultured Maribacter sp.]|uniref:hypothetical protein n=1 Tax=uncultured Maribacter sp. TaxID=431308 RepID=UPI002613186C|nr:hypothetical protein [uncultured Maribacter sp.]
MKAPNKNSGFRLPEDYLENFNDSLLNKIATSEESKIPNKEGFTVPKDYFDTLHKNISDKLEEKPTKVIAIQSYKKYYYSAIAAAIVLLFVGINLNKTVDYSIEDIANADIDSYIEYTDLNFSSYEIAEVVPIDNLDITDILDAGINEENIIDYLEDELDSFNEFNLDSYDY